MAECTDTVGDVTIGTPMDLATASHKQTFVEFYYPELKDLGKHFHLAVSGQASKTPIGPRLAHSVFLRAAHGF